MQRTTDKNLHHIIINNSNWISLINESKTASRLRKQKRFFIFFCVAKQRSPQSPLRSPATSSDVLLGDQAGALDSTLLAQVTRTQTGSYPARLPRKLSRQSCTLRDPEDASSRKRGLCVYKCSDSKYQLYYLSLGYMKGRVCIDFATENIKITMTVTTTTTITNTATRNTITVNGKQRHLWWQWTIYKSRLLVCFVAQERT